MSSAAQGTGGRASRRRLRPVAAVAAAFAAALLLVVLALVLSPSASTDQAQELKTNPSLDPGTALTGRAPDFRLTDQFGREISLRAYRGKVVLLAFNDAQCTTICPLTTAAMVQAKALLGAAGGGVVLLGVNANPDATAVRWVRSYSATHGMLHQWYFLTGSLSQLRPVWRAYHIEAQVIADQIDHTPAVYVIDRRGRLRALYEEQMAYASVPQQAQVYAQEMASLLPGHPHVRSHLGYAAVRTLGPSVRVSLPRADGGTLRIGGTGRPQLLVFFASWLRQTEPIASDLERIGAYQRLAAVGRLPSLVAVDEGSVEASPVALRSFLHGLPRALAFPVAIDRSGRVADGYEVQDQPWFVLTSGAGRPLWYWDATTQGWPTAAQLAAHVGAALASPPSVEAPTRSQAGALLAGSPPALAALHRQASHLLGGTGPLAARIRALRGYPIVVNVWASWCPNCRDEWPLFAAASAHYGRRVAFIGVDAQDPDASAASSWLRSHPVSYPSYTSIDGSLPVSGAAALPTTIYIDAAGNVTKRTTGIYDSQGALDGDIQQFAL